MAILAFDTCLGAVSAALNVDGRIIGRCEICPTGHAERLMPMIEGVLADAGQTFAAVSRIAVSLGPGGFTGLRVGISAARAFALALGVPVVGLPSLEVLAHGIADHLVCDGRAGDGFAVVAPAGRSGAYVQVFRCMPLASLGPPFLLAPDADDPRLAGVMAVGPGAALLSARVASVHEGSAGWLPDAAVLARLGSGLPPLIDVLPIYLRAADAKPQTGKGLARARDSRQT